MFKDNYSVKHSLKKLFLQRYERYLPTAFDESMSILEKMNKLIEAQNSLIDVVNSHTEFTSAQLERAFGIIDENLAKQLEQFRDELEEQKLLYEEIRDKIHSDLLPDSVKQKLEEWLLNGTIEELINDTVFSDFNERIEFLENILFPPEDKITFYVPRDFETLHDAFTFVRKLRNGIDTEIIMQKGFRPSSGYTLRNHDLGHVTLSSEDDVVMVADDFTGHFLHGYNAGLPVLNCLVDMRDRGGNSYRVEYSSEGTVRPQCGIINSGEGVYVRTSTVTAAYSKWTGSNDRACWVTRGSNVSFPHADFSGVKNGSNGIYLSRASIGDFSDVKINDCNVSGWAIYVVRSRATMLNAEFNNCTGGGLLATANSSVVISGCSGKNVGGNAIHVNNLSEVQLGGGSDISGAGGTAIMVRNGSSVNATSIRAVESGNYPLYVEQGSRVNIMSLNARNCKGDGVVVTGGSTASIPDCVISTATGVGLKVHDMSYANFSGALIQNTNGIGVDVSHGSTVSGRTALVNFSRTVSGDSESGTGVRVSYGSTANLVTARVRDSDLNDVNIRYGAMVSGHSLRTSNGKPSLQDTNVPAFNTLSGRGIFYGVDTPN